MKTIIKFLTLLIITFVSKVAVAQYPYTAVKYLYDANGNRWNRYSEQEQTLGKMGGSDTSSKKTDITKVIKESLADSFGIKEIVIFPNPTFNTLKVNIVSPFATPLGGTIKVFNMLGSTQYLEQKIQYTNDIDFSLLSTGYYLLKIEVNGEVKTFKVLKN